MKRRALSSIAPLDAREVQVRVLLHSYPRWKELQRAIAPVRVLTYVNSMLSDPAEDGGEKRADRGFLGARTHCGQGVRMMAAF